MLLLRLAALLQVAFLPGWLLLTVAGVRSRSAIEALVRAFATSLVANFLLVWLLTTVGLNRAPVLYVVFVAEVALFAWLQRGKPGPRDPFGGLAEAVRGAPVGFQLALAAALATTALFVGYFLMNADAVISEWDAVVSWNRWALDWAANRLPREAYHYPQLVPASWSTLYVFAGDTVIQAQPRLLQALYPLGVVLVFLGAGVRLRSARVLLAAPIWALLAHAQVPDASALSNGYVDLPVSFFALLAVTTILFADERSERTWWLALFFACGAALTKQAGIFVLLFVWGWALASGRGWRFGIGSAAAALLLAGGWYLAKEIQIRLGLDLSEVETVVSTVHGGRGALERLRFAAGLLGGLRYLGGTGIWGLLAAGALLVLSLREATLRGMILGLVLPFLAVWAFLYSYDTRNASLVVPVLALAFAHAIPGREVTWVPTRLQALGAAALLVGAFALFAYDEKEAQASQVAQQRQLDQAELNAALYRYFEGNPIRGKVYTGYQIFGFLPGFRGWMVVKGGIMSLADLDGAERDPEIAYVLEPPNWMSSEVRWAMEQRIRSGRYRHVFYVDTVYGPFRLVELRP